MDQEFLYRELSYKINGLAFEVDNTIGFGHSEKEYGDALEKLFMREKIPYKREVYSPLKVDGQLIKKKYFDYVIDEKVVVELKVADYQYKQACVQLFKYLKASGYKLGIIIRFTKDNVKIKRIPCFY